ncbi:UspA domain protein [Nostocoides japonicum T1-X7]|uniref:UspA domain protein n=1 Tax=Nostocoides japonicum T1-X7 TaxID=1194083 RepID=A0A077M2E0_9MICO|nr:universal stress protein [Tetrasphaera japonica]CCH79996.1 UspA domain protein [Tetrasphaera japonica T1-X7]
MKDYRTVVVGTDGSALAEPTVARAAWLATHEDADLVIVCAYAEMSRRLDAKNVATLGGDVRFGQVLGRGAASDALAQAVGLGKANGATIAAALLVEGEPAKALLSVAEERGADVIVVGARRDRSVADRLLGTVATEVTKQARCDVLIVRPVAETGDLVVPEDSPVDSWSPPPADDEPAAR